MIKRIVNVSGGKDSTAAYLFAMEKGKEFRAVFADVGNEAQETYDYISEMHIKTGGPKVEIIKADFSKELSKKAERLPAQWRAKGVSEEKIEKAVKLLKPSGNVFLDLCLTRSGFPSSKMRFCTDKLKIKPICEQVYRPIAKKGALIVSWQGVRRDESAKRSVLKWHEYRKVYGVRFCNFRPLLDWTVKDVFSFLYKHGVKPNPLYEKGLERVGCFPRIFSRKAEINLISTLSPEAIDRIEEWERLVGECSPFGMSTFFPASPLKIPGKINYKTHGVREISKWSGTRRGEWMKMKMNEGKENLQTRLFDAKQELEMNRSDVCSTYGLCE